MDAFMLVATIIIIVLAYFFFGTKAAEPAKAATRTSGPASSVRPKTETASPTQDAQETKFRSFMRLHKVVANHSCTTVSQTRCVLAVFVHLHVR